MKRDQDLVVGGVILGLFGLLALGLRSQGGAGGGGGGGDGGAAAELDPLILGLTTGWRWPVEPLDVQRFPAFADGAERMRFPRISDPRGSVRASGRYHEGVDIAFKRTRRATPALPDRTEWHDMPEGVRALAAGPGKVSVSRDDPRGGYVRIWHRGDIVTQYMHLSQRLVKAGDTVAAGQPIGRVGFDPTGYRFRHLHFELLAPGGERSIDPEPYLRGWSHTLTPELTRPVA